MKTRPSSQEEPFCSTCIEYMELIDSEPIGRIGIIKRYQCPKCGLDFEVVEKLEEEDYVSRASKSS